MSATASNVTPAVNMHQRGVIIAQRRTGTGCLPYQLLHALCAADTAELRTLAAGASCVWHCAAVHRGRIGRTDAAWHLPAKAAAQMMTAVLLLDSHDEAGADGAAVKSTEPAKARWGRV